MAGKKQQILNDKLIMAAQNGHFIDAKKWIRKGAQVDQPVEELFGITPIIIALGANPWTKGHYDIVHFLLKNGACPNQKYPFDEKTMSGDVPYTHREMSLLAMEVYHGRLGVLQLLVKHGADVNQKTEGNIGPLDVAIESGNFPIVKIILNEIEEKNPFSGLFGTALHTAAFYGDCDIFKYIFELSNEEKNPAHLVNRMTPLHHAASNGHFNIVEMILEEIEEMPIDSRGVTPLHEAALRGHEDIVNLLLDNSEQDKNHSDYDGNTPLLNAARNGHDRIVQLILDKVPTDELKDFNGRGPLHLAVEKADFLAVETLTEPECYSQLSVFDDEANTPLHLAAEMNHETILKRLLGVAEDKNPANVHRVTPLHCAAQHGSDTAVKLIMNEVSDVHPVNSNGETPLDLALNEGHTNVIELLRKHKKARLY